MDSKGQFYGVNFKGQPLQATIGNIFRLWTLEDQRSEFGLKLAFHLKKQTHLGPNNFVKQRVKYAVQLLSNTTRLGLLAKVSSSEATQAFCELFDKLFDVLNSHSKYDKPSRWPVEATDHEDPVGTSDQLQVRKSAFFQS